jgi:excisionase family DNA binding protein
MAASPDALGAAFAGLAAMPSGVAELRALLVRVNDRLERIEGRLPPTLVSLDDAAKALSVSRSTCKRMVAAGDLPSIRVGRLVRVDLSAMRPLSRDQVLTLAAAARATINHNRRAP